MDISVIVLVLLAMGLLAFYIGRYYRQKDLFGRYLSSSLSLFVHDKQEGKGRLMASIFIQIHFNEEKIASFVLKEVAVQNQHYRLGKFDQLVFVPQSVSDSAPMSISVHVDASELEKTSALGPMVVLRGTVHLKGGKLIDVSTKQRLTFEHGALHSMT